MAVSLDVLRKQLLAALSILKTMPPDRPLTTRERIYLAAKQALGTDASPLDQAPDYLACAETVTTIIDKVIPGIKWTARTSTHFLRKDLLNSTKFVRTTNPQPGDIVLSATGYGGKNGISHGHVGFLMEDGKIASNTSKTGMFDENFTVASWKRYYVQRGGYELLYFSAL